MKSIFKKIRIPLLLLLGIYILICTILYFSQEKLLFRTDILAHDHKFNFSIPFEEINLNSDDGTILNHLLFKADSSKGVVLFLHGNGGTLDMWGHGAGLYTNNGYDILYLDYRGYGKSTGHIYSEEQFIKDAQQSYDYLKTKYKEENIIVSGTSMGTGLATQIAAKNNPRHLILNAPYSSLVSLVKEKVKIVPNFLIKYKLRTNKTITKVKCPITIFHGDIDVVIPYHHSVRLKEISPKIDFHTIKGYGHYLRNSSLRNTEIIKVLQL